MEEAKRAGVLREKMKAVLPNVLSKWMSLCLMKREVLCKANKMTITVFQWF